MSTVREAALKDWRNEAVPVDDLQSCSTGGQSNSPVAELHLQQHQLHCLTAKLQMLLNVKADVFAERLFKGSLS